MAEKGTWAVRTERLSKFEAEKVKKEVVLTTDRAALPSSALASFRFLGPTLETKKNCTLAAPSLFPSGPDYHCPWPRAPPHRGRAMTTSCLFDWAQPSVHPSNGPTDTEANAVTAVKNDGSPQLATGRPTRSPLSRPRNHETSAQITWQAWNAFYRVETTVQPEEYRDDTEISRIKKQFPISSSSGIF